MYRGKKSLYEGRCPSSWLISVNGWWHHSWQQGTPEEDHTWWGGWCGDSKGHCWTCWICGTLETPLRWNKDCLGKESALEVDKGEPSKPWLGLRWDDVRRMRRQENLWATPTILLCKTVSIMSFGHWPRKFFCVPCVASSYLIASVLFPFSNPNLSSKHHLQSLHSCQGCLTQI